MQYCEWTHVIGEIITCRIVGSFMKGSDGHEHKAQREKKHGRDSSQCWRQWGWCCTCDTTHSHSPIQSLHSLTCTHNYVLLTQKYYAIQYILVFLFNFYLPFVLYLVFSFNITTLFPTPLLYVYYEYRGKHVLYACARWTLTRTLSFIILENNLELNGLRGYHASDIWSSKINRKVHADPCRIYQFWLSWNCTLYIQIYYCTLSLLLHD